MRLRHYIGLVVLMAGSLTFSAPQPSVIGSALIVGSGTTAQRPTAAAVVLGGLYFNTDDLTCDTTGSLEVSNSVDWRPICSTDGGVNLTLAAVGSSANANGATLTSNVLNLQPASASFSGVVTTGTQSMAGAKTFTGSLTANSIVSSTTFAGSGGVFATTTGGGVTTAELTVTSGANGIIFGAQRVLTSGAGAQTQVKGVVTSAALAEGVRLGNQNSLTHAGSKVAAFYSDAFTTLVGGIGFRGTLYSGAATIPNASGSPGAATQNTPRGRAAIALAATSVVITNDQVTADSVVLLTWEASPGQFWSVVPIAGSFTVTLAAAASGNITFRYVVVN